MVAMPEWWNGRHKALKTPRLHSRAGSSPASGTNYGVTMDDIDCWNTVDPADLWVTDKLILAKRLGYLCGPAGLAPPELNMYIVRPCVNYRMMSRGAQLMYVGPDNHNMIPDGYFWCEVFTGRHLTFDFHNGKQVLSVEGFRDGERLDRFSLWRKTDDQFVVPKVLEEIVARNEWVNFEVIGDKIIEMHFRYNDDFAGHDSNEVVPIWKDQFYSSPCGDRIGFLLK